jgi:hypothetical protein
VYGGQRRRCTWIAGPTLRIGGQRGEPLAVDRDRLGAGAPEPVDELRQVLVADRLVASPSGASSTVIRTPGP